MVKKLNPMEESDRRGLSVLESLDPSEVYGAIFAPIEQKIVEFVKSLLPVNSAKKNNIIPQYKDDQKGQKALSRWASRWIERIFIKHEMHLNYRLLIKPQLEESNVWQLHYFPERDFGTELRVARRKAMYEIKNSKTITPPQILFDEGKYMFHAADGGISPLSQADSQHNFCVIFGIWNMLNIFAHNADYIINKLHLLITVISFKGTTLSTFNLSSQNKVEKELNEDLIQ